MRRQLQRLIFPDETGTDTGMTREYGRSLRGERLKGSAPFRRWCNRTFFAGNFPNNIGLEVVRLDGLDGDGSTDLTIPDEFVFAGNGEPARPVRIEGGSTDTLRFDMDDFAEAPEPVGFGGETYRGFASDDQTWSFLVDADVMLFDI